jgi:hypothetical protein
MEQFPEPEKCEVVKVVFSASAECEDKTYSRQAKAASKLLSISRHPNRNCNS